MKINTRNSDVSYWERFVDALTSGVLVVDDVGKIVYANEFAGHLFARTADELIGEAFSYPLSRDAAQEIEVLRKDGGICVAEMFVRAGAWHDQHAWIISLHDITERRHTLEQQRLAASVFANTREGILITDKDANILEVNDQASKILGFSREELLGQHPRVLKSGKHPRQFYTNMWKMITDRGFWSGEIWNRRKNGDIYPITLTITSVQDPGETPTHLIAIFADITSQKQQQQLEHLAYYDPLTDLPNRMLLERRLQVALTRAKRKKKRMAVIYCDLDGFKSINDTYGHEMGDRLLVILADRFRNIIRSGDTFARVGGDEFIGLFNNYAEPENSSLLLERLVDAIRGPVHINGVSLRISASIGITLYPQSNEIGAAQLLRQADQAMYQAKLSGKNHYRYFDVELEQDLKNQHHDLDEIRKAIAENEFELFYQPKVHLSKGVIIGVEALIRWHHPKRGLLYPGDFLPRIESHPIALNLDHWVINRALDQLNIWREDGINLHVSVNIGALQLQSDNFVTYLKDLLQQYPKVNPNFLQLEILETSALQDVATASKVLNDCNALGVDFALDDFGTGFATLAYLKELRAAQLKIDQSFVRDMLNNLDDLAILKGIIGLAAAFKMEVIAEGVETVEHGTKLLQLGCELAQGYAIAKPMPESELREWVLTWQPDPAWSKFRLPILDA